MMPILKLMVALVISKVSTALINLLFSLNFCNAIPCWYASISILLLLFFIILSIFLTNSAASLGLTTFLDISSTPSLSICSDITDSHFSNTWSSFNFDFLVSSGPINLKKNCQFCSILFSQFESVLFSFVQLISVRFVQFCSVFVDYVSVNFVQFCSVNFSQFCSILFSFCQLSFSQFCSVLFNQCQSVLFSFVNYVSVSFVQL